MTREEIQRRWDAPEPPPAPLAVCMGCWQPEEWRYLIVSAGPWGDVRSWVTRCMNPDCRLGPTVIRALRDPGEKP